MVQTKAMAFRNEEEHRNKEEVRLQASTGILFNTNNNNATKEFWVILAL